MKAKIKGLLQPLLPALVVGALILGCATAPSLMEIPARLELVPAALAAETTPSGETEDALPQAEGDYPDGVYTGTGTGYGGQIKVSVTVENGQITKIDILSAPGETAQFFTRAKGVIDLILAAQTWEVDGISGATYSSNGIKAAVRNALTGEMDNLTQAKTTASGGGSAPTQVTYQEPTGGYKDGVYTGSAQGFGGTITMQVTISGGKITDVSVLSAPGETASYFAKAKAVISAILQAQSPNVDAVSGATYSSNGILQAVANALSGAKASQQEEPTPKPTEPTPTEPVPTEPTPTEPGVLPVDPPAPGIEVFTETYVGTAMVLADEYEDFWDYALTLTVTVSVKRETTVKDGLQTVVTERTVTDVSATADTDATNLAYLNRAFNGLKPQLLSGGDTIDAISGATCSSKGIREAWKAAMENVALGKTVETIQVPEDIDPPDVPEDTPVEDVKPTVEEFTETYTGSATVSADKYEDFWDYSITLTATIAVKKTITVEHNIQTTVTQRSVQEISVSADTDSTNLSFLNRALSGLKAQMMEGIIDIDAVSGATCSSQGIKLAWHAAMRGVELGQTVEQLDLTQ